MNRPDARDLFDRAKEELAEGRLTSERLDELYASVSAPPAIRQCLLYLHASMPSIRSPLYGCALHRPVRGSVTEIDPMAEELPYGCVHDAILDGWRVVHFPDQRAPFDDREIDVLGYEFVLEKMEPSDE
jgi:hypothetical protein